jgi:hypothetical protein
LFQQGSGNNSALLLYSQYVKAAGVLLVDASNDGLMLNSGSMKSLGASLQQQAQRSGLLRWLAALAQITAQQLDKHAAKKHGAAYNASSSSSSTAAAGSSGNSSSCGSSGGLGVIDSSLIAFTRKVLPALENVSTWSSVHGLDAAVGKAVAAVQAATMQLITAAAQLVGPSQSGQQLGPPLQLGSLVGSASSATYKLAVCALCGGPHRDVLASPEYLRWSSACAIIASYASLFQDTQCLPGFASSSTITNGSQTAAQTSSSQAGGRNSSKSGSSCSNRSSRDDGGSSKRSTHTAAGQSSNQQQGVGMSGDHDTWSGAAHAAWEGPMQQQHALPASHLELLSFLGFSKEAALWVAACWACRAQIKLPSLLDLTAVHPCKLFTEEYADEVQQQLAGGDTEADSIFHSPTRGMMQRLMAAQADPNQQQPGSAEYATLRHQLCVYMPAVTLYWVAVKQHSNYAAACREAGMCTAFVASVPASNIDSALGSWPANQAPAVSKVAVSDTVQAALMCINRLQQLRLTIAEPASSRSSSSAEQ